MNIEIIKWMVGYAEGFEIISKPFHEDDTECIEHKGVEHYDIDDLEDIAWWSDGFKYIIYPLLLQKAKIGWNKRCSSGDRILEVVGNTSERYLKYGRYQNIIDLNQTEDEEALEQALEYIYEQETE